MANKRLIDANRYEKLILNHRTSYLHKEDVIAALAKQPTVDNVEVVRCKDCKYRFKNNGHIKDGCPIVDVNIWMDDDDFCSHGERKEGAE